MGKKGTQKNPVIIRFNDFSKQEEIIALCEKYKLQFIAGIEPDKREDISDLKKIVKPEEYNAVAHDDYSSESQGGFFNFKKAPSRNAPCTCGSGKLYKRCCGA